VGCQHVQSHIFAAFTIRLQCHLLLVIFVLGHPSFKAIAAVHPVPPVSRQYPKPIGNGSKSAPLARLLRRIRGLTLVGDMIRHGITPTTLTALYVIELLVISIPSKWQVALLFKALLHSFTLVHLHQSSSPLWFALIWIIQFSCLLLHVFSQSINFATTLVTMHCLSVAS